MPTRAAILLFLFPALLVTVLGCRPQGAAEGDGTCRLSFSDEGTARVFVVGHAFVPDDALTYLKSVNA